MASQLGGLMLLYRLQGRSVRTQCSLTTFQAGQTWVRAYASLWWRMLLESRLLIASLAITKQSRFLLGASLSTGLVWPPPLWPPCT